MNIKIGDKVKVKKNINDHSNFWEDCDSAEAEYLIITYIYNNGIYGWNAYNKDGETIDNCFRHGLIADDFIPYKETPRTIEEVQEDDLITDGTYFRRVLGRTGKVVFVTSLWGKGEKEKTTAYIYYSIQELKDNNYTIVNEEEPETITIEGKTYNKKEFDERLKELKEVAINKE